MNKLFFIMVFTLFFHSNISADHVDDLLNLYQLQKNKTSDINEHLPVLRDLAKDCSSIIELANRGCSSTWALFLGLCESKSSYKRYIEIEAKTHSPEKLQLAKRLAKECNISYQFIIGDIMSVNIDERADLLFIDSIHTYCQLLHELETLSPKINKYIAMHDTNYPWGYYNDTEYTGDFSEYPAHLNRSKKGLVEAINDFLSINPGWQIKEVRMNNYGLTILERVSKKAMKDNPDIHIFIHACTLANWKDVLNRQLSRIYDSGLYHAATSINIGVLGTESIDEFKLKYPKIKQLFQKPDVKLYERPTLYCLHETCVKNPGDSVVLYLHTKGITRTNPYVTDWTLLMEHFLIDNWQNCLEELKRADTCGLNYQPMPARHYSGNFWWANSNHISTLPAKIGPCYVDPETWIGLNNPNMKCIYQSNVDHYNLPYPESKYKTK